MFLSNYENKAKSIIIVIIFLFRNDGFKGDKIILKLNIEN